MQTTAFDLRSARSNVARQLLAETSVLALAGFAVVGLHLADDSFVHPEAGTSALDHLAGGLVPLVALGLATYAYRHGRSGLRASIAILVGVLALVVGMTSAVYETLTVGPSGDDFTGLLVLPAGLVLIGVGVATLWKSRRLDDSLPWRYGRRMLLAVTAVVIGLSVVFPIGLGFGATHVIRQTVPDAHLGVAHENVAFTTSDGLVLRGWYIPSRNGAAVIAFPGRSGPQAHARMLARHGYGVLLFDRRGEGGSEGASNLFGWGGDRDILAAIEYLRTRPDVDPDRIGGLGLSVGGELMLQTAAETDDLAAVVSEGAGTRWLAEEIEEYDTIDGSTKWLSLPTYAVKTLAVAVFSNTAPPPKLTDLARRIERPAFVIWAPNGGNAETMSPVYYRLARGPKQLWTIPDAKHVQGIYAHPKKYERRVVGFFDQALLGDR